jgi:alcohol dehydrogenase class IV
MAYPEDLSFLFLSPTRIVYGARAASEVAVELGNLGCRKAVIVTDRFLLERTDLVRRLEKSLGAACVGVFADVPSDSGVHVVNEGHAFGACTW